MKHTLTVITLIFTLSFLAFGGVSVRENVSGGAEGAALIPASVMAPPSATDGVYWGGDKIRRADLNGSNPTFPWNFVGAPVAVDRGQNRIYWGDNSTLPGKIYWGDLNSPGTRT